MSFSGLSTNILREIIGNKAKEQISKRVIQENKACQIFQKTIFLTHWYAQVSRGEKSV